MCENKVNMEVNCPTFGKGMHNFWTYPVSDLISHTFKSRPWAYRVVAITHNAKKLNLLFVVNRLVEMKLMSDILIMKRQNIMCLKVENVTWLDSLNYLAMTIRKLPEAFVPSAQKS